MEPTPSSSSSTSADWWREYHSRPSRGDGSKDATFLPGTKSTRSTISRDRHVQSSCSRAQARINVARRSAPPREKKDNTTAYALQRAILFSPRGTGKKCDIPLHGENGAEDATDVLTTLLHAYYHAGKRPGEQPQSRRKSGSTNERRSFPSGGGDASVEVRIRLRHRLLSTQFQVLRSATASSLCFCTVMPPVMSPVMPPVMPAQIIPTTVILSNATSVLLPV